MVHRHALLALSALIAGAGCHAGPAGNVAKQDPPLTKSMVSVTNFVERHNKNAATIKSLQAAPSIHVLLANGETHRVNGRMAMERPKNFRLELQTTLSKAADIGSNGQGFWFWVRNNPDKAIYVCDYNHLDSSHLAETMQPDWIIESLGLREITEREAATISAKPGDRDGLLVLTQFRKDARGESLTKETVVDETNGHILEHRLYAGAKKELLARATITQYQAVKMEPTEADPAGAIVQIPQKFRLEWLVEKFSLDVTMGQPKINPQFPRDQRVALFSEPTISGATRLDLARIAAPANAANSRIHETMPAPRSGVRLGQPESMPIGVEGALRDEVEPVALADDGADRPSETVIGAPIPQGTDPPGVQAAARARRRPLAIEQ